MIEFWDHSKDSEELVFARVCGIVRTLDKKKVVISTWDCPLEDLDVRKLNDELYAIALSTVERWGYLEPETNYVKKS